MAESCDADYAIFRLNGTLASGTFPVPLYREVFFVFDTIIRGGAVLDGTGAPAFFADIAVKDGRIAAVAPHITAVAAREIDAAGRTVTPGFLDIHRHGDLAVFRPGFGELELRQGLTTIVNGNCGMSAAPFGPAHRAGILEYLSPVIGTGSVPTESVAAYCSAVRKLALPIHVGLLAGSGVIRADVAGFAAGELDRDQLRAVHAGMERALGEGALGVSLGLGYAPDCFYDTQGLIDALAPLAGTDVPLCVHMRDEGSNVERSVEEMLTVAKALGCPVELSHLKAIGRENWGSRIPRVLARLARARAEGVRVSWDVYPYTAGSTQLLHILPPEILEGGTEALCKKLLDPDCRAYIRTRLQTGSDYNNISQLVGWENILLSTLNRPEHQPLLGKSLAEVSALLGQAPDLCAMDLLAAERCTITMIDFITAEEDIAAILRSEGASVISDATYPTAGRPHPRLYGNFARLIEKYVFQDGVLTLPEAIHKMTGAPAAALGLAGKGVIAPGMDADLNIFDPREVHESGTYLEPAVFARGIDTVLVSGEVALANGSLTGCCGGRVLTR